MDDASKYKNRPDTPVCSNVHGRVCFHLGMGDRAKAAELYHFRNKSYDRNRHVSYSTRVAVFEKAIFKPITCNSIPSHVTDLEFLVLKVVAPVQVLIAVIYRPPHYKTNSLMPNLSPVGLFATCYCIKTLNIFVTHFNIQYTFLKLCEMLTKTNQEK